MQRSAHHGDGATLFKGKHFLVTGVASGIGEETARMLLAAEARVTGMDLCEPAIGCERFVMLDQGDAASVDAAVQALDSGFDGLCNIAGVPPGDRFTPAQILKVNFYGLRRLTLGVEPSLNDGAAVVNVASAAGMGWMSNLERNRTFLAIEDFDAVDAAVTEHGIHNEGLVSQAAYPFSKELVITWTMKHSVDGLARGIRVNAVSPGATRTPILQDFVDNFGEIVQRRIADIGASAPEQIARVLLFLLSPQSARINGANLPVDGGVSARALSGRLGL